MNTPDSPPFLRPPHPPQPLGFRLPDGACDTHFHIYEDGSRLREDRRYTPVAAGLAEYRRMAETLGLARGVVVTGSAHLSNDPSLAAIAAMGGALKGLALVREEIDDADLERLAAGGMTGFRISTRSVGGMGPEALARMAARVRPLGWHVEIHMRDTEELLALLPALKGLPIPYSIDHVAYLGPGQGPGTPGFEAVLRMLREEENAYLNLYASYDLGTAGPPDYEDMLPVLSALIAARPDRILWGSNWPHPSFERPVPSDADLLRLLARAGEDDDTLRQILVENPARLYGFPESIRV